jgi:polysaccharide biosynthesis protein PslG
MTLVRDAPLEANALKYRVPSLAILVVLWFAAAELIPASAESHQSLFSMSMNGGVIADYHPEPWPSDYFKGFRLWNTGTTWLDMNTANGVYDWTQLDKWLAATGKHGNDVLYTFAGVPQWASSNPNDKVCLEQPGACDPPDDLNSDGTGPDQHWKDFVTALAQHNQNSSTGHISYWEMWNEPHNNFFWNGNSPQLVRMVADAYAIIKAYDPNAIVLSPSVGWQSGAPMRWFGDFIAAGGAKYVDKISCHGYSKNGNKYGPPENMVKDLIPYRASLKALGFGSTQIWDTEANWGPNLVTDPDMQSGWLARFFLLHVSESIKRLYWFMWNGGPLGGLWKSDPHDHSNPGTLLKPGIAYREVSKWIIGATLTNKCSSQGSVWTCGFSRSGGYQALAVWDAADTCNNGKCSTTKYYFTGNYLSYRTVYGHKFKISGSHVPIGARPVLLENQ